MPSPTTVRPPKSTVQQVRYASFLGSTWSRIFHISSFRLNCRLMGLCLFWLPAVFATNTTVSLKDHYPQYYVVQEGDTLYDIAGRYLSKPWEWPKIWRVNSTLKRPARLYPGMVLKLAYLDGYPKLMVVRRGTYKLSPQARPRPAQKPVPPINLIDIEPFLNGSLVLDHDELAQAGYVVGFKGEHLRGGQDQQIYVKNLTGGGKSGLSYAVYREDGVYTDPQHPTRLLGHKALRVGSGQLIHDGNPATIELFRITQGVKLTDRVVLNDKPEFNLYFIPKAPNVTTKGQVIDILGGLDQVATNQIIVIDQGKQEGIEDGDIIALWKKRRTVEDPLNRDETIRLPKERSGEAMVFRAFRHTAFALIVKSIEAIQRGDTYTNP